MKLQKEVRITEFKLLPHGFLNYDILPFMAEECGNAIFKIAQSMKEFLFKRTSFLDSDIPEIEESEDDMLDQFLEKIGMSSKSDEHRVGYFTQALNTVITPVMTKLLN